MILNSKLKPAWDASSISAHPEIKHPLFQNSKLPLITKKIKIKKASMKKESPLLDSEIMSFKSLKNLKSLISMRKMLKMINKVVKE